MKFRITIFTIFISIFIFSFAQGKTLDDFEYEITESGAVILSYAGDKSDVSIPLVLEDQNVTAIADHAFENNVKLTQISMPSAIEIIGDRAFAGCTNLNAVNISYGLKRIGNEAFADCYGLSYFVLPATLETIGRKAFDNCENIVYFYDLTGDSLSEIGSGAFDDTAWFKNSYGEYITLSQGQFLLKYLADAPTFTVPWNVFYIAEDAFSGNDQIETLYLSNNLVKLQAGSLSNMASLTGIYNSGELISIADGAFRNLPNLQTVDFTNNTMKTSYFIDCPLSPVGSESSGTYKAFADDDADQIFISEYDDNAGGVIILHCKKEAKIPDGELIIPDYIRGKRVVAIGVGACQDRPDIHKVVFPEYLREIRSWAFAYDLHLTEVSFPKSLEKIEADAFTNCSLTISEAELTDAEIDPRAFYKMNNY